MITFGLLLPSLSNVPISYFYAGHRLDISHRAVLLRQSYNWCPLSPNQYKRCTLVLVYHSVRYSRRYYINDKRCVRLSSVSKYRVDLLTGHKTIEHKLFPFECAQGNLLANANVIIPQLPLLLLQSYLQYPNRSRLEFQLVEKQPCLIVLSGVPKCHYGIR